MIGRIDHPESLLLELDRDRWGLVLAGMRKDGQPTHFVYDSESPVHHTNWVTVWLMGNSLVTRELSFGLGRHRDEWYSSFTDVDLNEGHVYRYDESSLGEGGLWLDVFEEDFHPGTDGVKLRQLHNTLVHLVVECATDSYVIHTEIPLSQ